ncbi:MAG TPA: hypothetical protein VF798_01460, partial [Burkholderiaceae bacterium]
MKALVLACLFGLGAATGSAGAAEPPVAAQHPYEVPSPNGARSDPYYWIRDDTRKNPEMLK